MLGNDDNSTESAMQGETFAVLMALLMLLLCIARFDSEKGTAVQKDAPQVDPPAEPSSIAIPTPTPLPVNERKKIPIPMATLKPTQTPWPTPTPVPSVAPQPATVEMLPNQQATYPMLVKLSSGQLFEKSTFELSEAGKELLRSRIAELIDTASKTGSDTIEVIGHTDGQDYRLDRERAFFGGLAEREGGREYDPVRRKFVTKQPIGIVKLDAAAFDFDGTLHRYLEGTENALAPHGYQIQFQDRSSRLPKAPVWVLSNVELGMARAATVARYLKGQLPSGPIKTVRVYSAGQFLDSDGSPANSNATQDDFRRRRVELRLTRTQD